MGCAKSRTFNFPRPVSACNIRGLVWHRSCTPSGVNYLFILNDPPYGTERSYNALRLATALTKIENSRVSVFLLGDAAVCALAGQTTPTGYYNLERMLKILKSKGASIGVCGTCMDGRGIKLEMLAEGAHRSSMDELAAWTAAADRVLVF